MKYVALISMLVIVALSCPGKAAYAHCEMPCGIYGDNMRIEMIKEDIDTIEKAMRRINDISASPEKDYNQLVRWINTKEKHANKIQHVVYTYFMDQRVKPVSSENSRDEKKYLSELRTLHKIAVSAMKSKQTTDMRYVSDMRSALDDFVSSYMGQKESAEMGSGSHAQIEKR